MTDKHTQVHATHCCKDHGCKYGDDDCPVVSRKVKQEYDCEDCGTFSWYEVLHTKAWVGHIDKMAEYADALGFQHLLWNDRIYSKIDGRWQDTNYTIDNVI